MSLELRIWAAVDSFRKKNGIRDVSSAIEELLERKLKELGEMK